MRTRLDCAALDFTTVPSTHTPISAYANGRLFLHHISNSKAKEINSKMASQVLMQLAGVLHRFDACLLTVDLAHLAWARQALSVAQPHFTIPIIVLVKDLTAPAINDLYQFGMTDFIRQPFCGEELRVRLERILRRIKLPKAAQYNDKGGNYCSVDPPASSHQLKELEALAYYFQTNKSVEGFAKVSVAQPEPDSSFQDAKAEIITRFERAYLLASLAKTSGNIALAARNARKDRRAYWALMRKHRIDAGPFRAISNKTHHSPDG